MSERLPTLFVGTVLLGPLCSDVGHAQVRSNWFSGGDALCDDSEKCRQGTCVPECDDDAQCPDAFAVWDLNGQKLQLCQGDACIYNRSAGLQTPVCEGEMAGAWAAHFIDPAVACDEAPLLAPEVARGHGGDYGADGVVIRLAVIWRGSRRPYRMMSAAM